MAAIYVLSRLVPPRENLWIFGAWFGAEYSDNPRYLFEHIYREHPDLRAVWLTKDKNLIRLLRMRGFAAASTYGPLGCYLSARASTGVVCCSPADLNKVIPPRRVLNTWHGNPLKKIVNDDLLSGNGQAPRTVIDQLMPSRAAIRRLETDVLASSHEEAQHLQSAFNVREDQVHVTGLPRNDGLTEEMPANARLQVLYMPTHRQEGKGSQIGRWVESLKAIDAELGHLGAVLTVRLHHYHRSSQVEELAHVRSWEQAYGDRDLYEVLGKVDVLVTDYSSVWFDFLLTKRPIIFAPFDIDEYVLSDRELYYDYETIIPGPKCHDWVQVAYWLKRFKADPLLWADEREVALHRFHEYRDGAACTRIVARMRKQQGAAPLARMTRRRLI